jgi:hypothetical protein
MVVIAMRPDPITVEMPLMREGVSADDLLQTRTDQNLDAMAGGKVGHSLRNTL